MRVSVLPSSCAALAVRTRRRRPRSEPVLDEARDREASASGPRMPRVVAVRVYVLLVLATGVLISVRATMLEIPQVPWLSWDTSSGYMLAVLLFAGELRSLTLIRPRGDPAEVTISTTFAVALAVIGPVSLALLAQTVAVVFDESADGASRR